MTPSSPDKIDLLVRRAENLARPIEHLESREASTTLLVFTLLAKPYSVPLTHVISVMRILEVVSIPSAPKHIPGIIRRRGESIGLVNLAYYFHADRTGIADADFAVIVQAHGRKFALQVEDIVGAVAVRNADLLPPQDNFDPAQYPYVKYVMLDGLAVLDLDALVQSKGFVAEKTV